VEIGVIPHINITPRDDFDIEFDDETSQKIYSEFTLDRFFGNYAAPNHLCGKTNLTPSVDLDNIVSTPQMIAISNTNVCNSRCEFCPSKNMRRKQHIMTTDLFCKSVREAVLTGCRHLRISPQIGDGLLDPLLPEKLEILEDIGRDGLTVSIITNMIGLDRFTDGEVKALLKFFTNIYISVGPNRFVYKNMFGVDRFEKVLKNLHRLAKIRHFVEQPAKIGFNGRACGDDFVVDPGLEEICEQLTGKRNIDWRRQYYNWGLGYELSKLPLNTPVIEASLPEKGIFPCWYATNPKIYFDGQFALCSYAGITEDFICGDINIDNLDQLLNSPLRKDFLLSFLEGRFPRHCTKCSFYLPDRSIDWSVFVKDDHLSQEPSPENFSDFSYARSRHFDKLSKWSIELYSHDIDPKDSDLKVYQDLFVFSFLKKNILPGSRILEIGGGHSRVLGRIYDRYECWNLDKFEGLGHGPKDIIDVPYKTVKAYIGDFSAEIPERYFDFVFSISALEHVDTHDYKLHGRIINDIDRVLKPGGYSLHCFDVVIDTKMEQKYYDYIYHGLSIAQGLSPDWEKGFKPENRNLGHWSEVYIPDIVKAFFDVPGALNDMPSEEELKFSCDVWTMSKEAFDRGWKPIVKRSYNEVGRPTSINVLWQKAITN
jgi:MoaA/NifB/PqqE/SkfB family radical SAM enzyme